MTIHELTLKALTIKAALMLKDYDVVADVAEKLQTTLEDLEGEDYILIRKDDLRELIQDEYGSWSDTSYPILQQIGIDPREGL